MVQIISKTEIDISLPAYSSANPNSVIKHYQDRSYEVSQKQNGMFEVKLLSGIAQFVFDNSVENFSEQKQKELAHRFNVYWQEFLKKINE